MPTQKIQHHAFVFYEFSDEYYIRRPLMLPRQNYNWRYSGRYFVTLKIKLFSTAEQQVVMLSLARKRTESL